MNIINFTSLLTIVNFIVVIGTAIGAYFIIRFGLGQLSSEIQKRVREGLLDENELLRSDVSRLEAKVDHLEAMLETTVKLLEEKGFTLTIGEDTVTLEGEGKVSNIRRKVQPVKKPVVKPAPKKEIP